MTLARLRALAERFKDGASVEELKEYWRAANPATVLALLDLIDSQSAALEEAAEIISEDGGSLTRSRAQQWRDRLAALSAAPSIAARREEG